VCRLLVTGSLCFFFSRLSYNKNYEEYNTLYSMNVSSLPPSSVAVSCLPERKISLRFARFGAVCMHCVQQSNTGGSCSTSSFATCAPEPPNNVDKLRVRKPVPSNSKCKSYHRRCFSASSQGMLSSKGCAALAAFENLTLADSSDESPSKSASFKSLLSPDMPPTPVLGPTIVFKEPPVFSELDCDTVTPSSECMSPPPLDL